MSKQTTKSNLIIVAFQAAIISGCDYAIQTIEILGKRSNVIGLAFGEPITWRDVFSPYNKKRIVEKYKNYTLFRPFFFVPGQRIFFIKKINLFFNAVLLRLYVSLFYSQEKKYFWFFEPVFMPTFYRVFSSYITVFDCVDYFLTLPQPFLSHMLFMLQNSTHVFVNSHVLQKEYSRYRSNTTVVPLGFAYHLFSQKQVKQKNNLAKFKRIGFVGGIDERLDFELLYKTAKSLINNKFIFVGKNYFSHKSTPLIVQSLYSLPNVTFINEVCKSKIPEIIQSLDICLIPYDSKQLFNRYCFPMKTLEYFFYGKPVISTDIVELRRFQNELSIVSSYKELIQEIKVITKNDWPLNTQKRQRLIAIQNSWERKVRSIEKLII